MSGMLLLIDEKVFVVFTVCVWTWVFFGECLCMRVVRENDTQCTYLQILKTDNIWHVRCVRENGLFLYGFAVLTLIYDALCSSPLLYHAVSV